MSIPYEIMAAVRDGDTHTVLRFLDEGGDIDAVDAHGMTLLLGSVRCSKVELCRVLLERGADPNETLRPHNEKKTDLLWVAAYVADGGVLKPPQGGGAAWSASPSGKLFELLWESAASLIVPTCFNPRGGTDHTMEGSLLARLLFCFGRRVQDDNSVLLEIVTTVLRADAGDARADQRPESRHESIVYYRDWDRWFSASWCLEQALENTPALAQDEHFMMTKDLIVDIQEEGSLKRALRRPHRAVLRLRWLVCRGRAKPRRAFTFFSSGRAIEFLCKELDSDGYDGIVWNILSFWRASN